VPVTVGLMNEELAETLDGLSTEDQVVPAPEADLADGQPVRPKLVDRY